jgi:two-component system OmpR family sensor kinase
MGHQKDSMQSYALQVASKVITSYMQNQTLSVDKNPKYKIALFDADEKKIYGDELGKIDFSQEFYRYQNSSYFISLGAQLHHGVKYIVVKNENSHELLTTLKQNIIIYSLIVILVVSFVGYFLSKLFLIPIQNERLKLDQFIKDTTHELNTPISALMMSVNILKTKNIEQKISQRIDLSAKRIHKIYSDLTYLLVEHKDSVEDMNIKDIVLEELELYEVLANKKDIVIEKNLNDLEILMDKESCKRVVSNLISNAIKYNKPSGTIKIITDDAKITFQDSGIGVEREHLNNLFKRYYRANSYEGGFGIGLDIVKQICDKYGIEIKIDSTINVGTSITLDLSKLKPN